MQVLDDTTEDMPDELDLDWSKAQPNIYAGHVRRRALIELDSDVAEVFTTAESVNTALRGLINTMPSTARE
jgi:hypothetical protein